MQSISISMPGVWNGVTCATGGFAGWLCRSNARGANLLSASNAGNLTTFDAGYANRIVFPCFHWMAGGGTITWVLALATFAVPRLLGLCQRPMQPLQLDHG